MPKKELLFVIVGIILCLAMLIGRFIWSSHLKSPDKDIDTEKQTTTTTTITSLTKTTEVTTETTVANTTESNDIDRTLSYEEQQGRHGDYANEIVVVGDSIASGFHLYGFILEEHGLAQGSTGIRNIHDFTFLHNGMDMDVSDILEEIQPAYIYMSMGMNDVNMITSTEYKEKYKNEIENTLRICPDSNIIIAGITPISYGNEFTDNSTILEFNSELKSLVEEFSLPNLKYYDAYNVLADPNTNALKEEFSAGDGIHLSTQSYELLLEGLYPILDEMPLSKKPSSDNNMDNSISITTTTTVSDSNDMSGYNEYDSSLDDTSGYSDYGYDNNSQW